MFYYSMENNSLKPRVILLNSYNDGLYVVADEVYATSDIKEILTLTSPSGEVLRVKGDIPQGKNTNIMLEIVYGTKTQEL